MPLAFGNVREGPLTDILKHIWTHSMFEDPCMKKECPMFNIEFRKKYLSCIGPETKLPIRI
ncbi:MAG: hypothetical protein ACTSRW_11820 [Candidatus Helarchaeota archaeon]